MQDKVSLNSFNGSDTEDVDRSLWSVERAARTNTWTEIDKLNALISAFDGYALDWFDRCVALGTLEEPGDYKKLCTALRSRYKSSAVKERLLDQFDALQQGPEESVKEYDGRFSQVVEALGKTIGIEENASEDFEFKARSFKQPRLKP